MTVRLEREYFIAWLHSRDKIHSTAADEIGQGENSATIIS